MIMNLTQGGGSELNYKIVGGASAPANPKENTIWINTDVAIPEYIFSNSQPSDVSNGAVWIQTTVSSNIQFNALKKNKLMVYLNTVKQYVDGSWVDKEITIYQNGKWNVLEITIYNGGQPSGWWAGEDGHGGYSFSSSGIYIRSRGSYETGTGVAAFTSPIMDLTPYESVAITVSTYEKNLAENQAIIGVSSNSTTLSPNFVVSTSPGGTGTFTLNIKNVNSGAIAGRVFSYAFTNFYSRMTISKVVLKASS